MKRKMKMEIPTDKIIEEIERDGEQDEVLKIIKAQALEIRELQAVIVRLRDEIGAMGEELDSENAKIIKLEKTS
jgi:hypothetical protein